MKQFAVSAALIVAVTLYLGFLSGVKPTQPARDLDSLPRQIGSFTMVESRFFDDDTLAVLGVDHYIMRRYQNGTGSSLWLYIGYYESQTQGSMIHSPKHCMPGSGWNTIAGATVDFPDPAAGSPVKINRVLLGKGDRKQLMHYWYQGRGRIVANEYLDRFYLVLDSFFRKRSDGALIRITGEGDATGKAVETQQQFISALLSILHSYFRP